MGWKEPYEFNEIERVFPSTATEHAPEWEEIPDDFKNSLDQVRHPACDVVSRWRYGDLVSEYSFPDFHGRPGIKPEVAFWHIQCVLGCYGFKDEHKMAAAAMLVDRYFSKVVKGDDVWLMTTDPEVESESPEESRGAAQNVET